jgi:predicted permease
MSVGLVPLFRVHPDRLHEVLKDGSRGSSHSGSALGRVLVAGEVGLAVLVVAGAGLLANSMWRLQQVDLGVADAERVMTFRMSLPGAAYSGDGAIPAFTDELGARLAAVPGVEAVGFVNRLPLLGGDNTTVSVFGDPSRSGDFVSERLITPGYFDAVGVPLLAGRWLEPEEYRGATPSVIINRTLARSLFGTEEAVGQRISNFMTPDGDGLVVVGVCGDIAGGRPDQPAPPAFYHPAASALAVWGSLPASQTWFVSALVKTSGDPHGSLSALRSAVASVDPDLPIYDPLTLDEIARDRLGIRRFAMSIFGVFAGLALLLGAVGIYGVMSFTVAQRAPEMGMRLALGASRGSVLRMVLGHGVRMTAPGLVLGLAAALASARVLGNLLFEVSPLDPWTYGGVAALLGLVSLAATLLPALRATRADPLASIRSE